MRTPLKVRIGVVVWCGFTYFSVPRLHDEAWAYSLLLLAALVLVPMAWCLSRDDEDGPRAVAVHRAALVLQLPAAVLLIGAVMLPVGPVAVLCTVPWVAALALMTGVGLARVMRRRMIPPADLVRDAGLIYPVIGGVWLLADRAGMQPLGFSHSIVVLTAVHFHYAGMILPIAAGLALSHRPASPLGVPTVLGVILGVPLVAVGITATQMGWGRGLELLATLILVLAGWGVANLHWQLVLRDVSAPRLTRALWGVAAMSLAVGMLLAALYALRSLGLPWAWLDIPWMRALHGSFNALGFSLAVLLAWCRIGRCCEICRR